MYQDVIDFWFDEKHKKLWFSSSKEFDQLIEDKFLGLHKKVSQNQTKDWKDTNLGKLAEIIVLDQFSRNIFRNSSESYAYDQMAQALTLEAIKEGSDEALNPSEKAFMYMPLMHSESLELHNLAVDKFSQKNLESYYNFELKHKAIIERFGRYPHRNKILGRTSTPEEEKFLKEIGIGW